MRNPYYNGPRSDHFDGVRFFNPGQPSTDRSLLDGLRWKLSQRAAKWSAWPNVDLVRPAARVDALRITMVGHATLLIQAAGRNYLTDPVWSDRASPVSFAGPKRWTAPGVAFDDLPPIDAVLISHAHYDHFDLATLVRLHRRDRPLFVAPLGNDVLIRRAIDDARVEVGDWFDHIELGHGAWTTLTPANHWANRSPFDYRMVLWSGHFLDTPAGSVWFAGDTGYGDGSIFGTIRERLGSPDVGLIPIGAYDPRWFISAAHASPEDAVRIFQDINPDRALGIHWGTFKLTDEPRDEPAELLGTAMHAAGIASHRFVPARPADVFEKESGSRRTDARL